MRESRSSLIGGARRSRGSGLSSKRPTPKWSRSGSGVPVWEHAGIICTGETYKAIVKLTFVKGASLKDPSGLFNSGLEGNTRRAIDFYEGDKIDEKALKALVRAAVTLNTSARAAPRPVHSQKKTEERSRRSLLGLRAAPHPSFSSAHDRAVRQAIPAKGLAAVR